MSEIQALIVICQLAIISGVLLRIWRDGPHGGGEA